MSVATVVSKASHYVIPTFGAAPQFETGDAPQGAPAPFAPDAATSRGTQQATAVELPAAMHNDLHKLNDPVLHTFARLGIAMAPSRLFIAGLPAAGGQSGVPGSRSDTAAVSKDMRAFLHALFQALNSTGGAGAANSAVSSQASVGSKYDLSSGGLAASIKGLAGAMNSSLPGVSAFDQLQSAYQKLLSDLPRAQPAVSVQTDTPTTLQSFLQALSTEVQDYAVPAVGNTLSAVA